jgi:hypothetical protein
MGIIRGIIDKNGAHLGYSLSRFKIILNIIKISDQAIIKNYILLKDNARAATAAAPKSKATSRIDPSREGTRYWWPSSASAVRRQSPRDQQTAGFKREKRPTKARNQSQYKLP